MKLIARVDQGTFLCEISTNELQSIAGMDLDSDLYVSFKVGDVIDTGDLINAAKWIKGLDAKHLAEVEKGVARVKRSVEKLNLLNTLRSIDPAPKKEDYDDDIPF